MRMRPFHISRSASNCLSRRSVKSNKRGFGQFLMRGLDKVAGERGLICLAHNVRKLARGRSLPQAAHAAA